MASAKKSLHLINPEKLSRRLHILKRQCIAPAVIHVNKQKKMTFILSSTFILSANNHYYYIWPGIRCLALMLMLLKNIFETDIPVFYCVLNDSLITDIVSCKRLDGHKK
ncbi:hypothetical protein T01_8281 [Trichinella spiralis]|uniref:Uncharacterized protein n=1 Tax=Trichinella spiralis TaxID=6334 RepID=A0A0V1B4P6_TRISP|nr:hypothetical protein T01_8281 [Trichinella spiralis]